MEKGKPEKIREILRGEYGDKMSEETIEAFTAELNYSLFIAQYDLDDIPPIIYGYETEAGIEVSEWCYIFGCLIDLLDDCKATAQRLYKSFMFDFDLPDTFLKLYLYNEEYLSAEELENIKKKAIGLFDREILKAYGVID